MSGMLSSVGAGTLSWPKMCCRSSGTPYFFARYFTRRAEDRYICSVNQASGCRRNPSCSMPIERAFTNWLPECQAASLILTCWVMWPSLERME